MNWLTKLALEDKVTSYDILTALIEQDNHRMYETVGQPVPNTVTVINGAEMAIGFEPVAEPVKAIHSEVERTDLAHQS
jgi:hypothetical protein